MTKEQLAFNDSPMRVANSMLAPPPHLRQTAEPTLSDRSASRDGSRSYLYLSEERSARFLSRRERFNASIPAKASSCTQAIVVCAALNLSLTLSSDKERG